MPKQISQDYFIETVQSTMEMLEISEEEAITDTIDSFKAQGIDLSNIDVKNLDKNASAQLLNDIHTLLSKKKDSNFYSALKNVAKEIKKGINQRVSISTNHDLLTVFVDLCDYQSEDDLLLMKTCSELIDGNPDIVKSTHIDKILEQLKSCFNADSKNGTLSNGFLYYALDFLSDSCKKHEGNRKYIFDKNMMEFVYNMSKKYLSSMPNIEDSEKAIESLEEKSDELHKNTSQVIHNCCKLLRSLVKDDDLRVEFGQGCMNAVAFCESNDIFEVFLNYIKTKKLPLNTILQMIITLNFTVVRENFCQRVLQVDGLEIIISLFIKNYENNIIVNALIEFMNVLSHSDSVRAKISKITLHDNQHNIPSVLFSLVDDRIDEASIVRSIMLLFSNMTLRHPDNGKEIILLGLPELCSKIFQRYKSKNAEIIRATCLTIRNSIARNPECITLFVPVESIVSHKEAKYVEASSVTVMDLEIEKHLNDFIKIKGCSDEAKGAARDLGLKVDLKNEYMNK